MVLFERRSLGVALRAYIEHAHMERHHQVLGFRLIDPDSAPPLGSVHRRQRLGDLLNFYHVRILTSPHAALSAVKLGSCSVLWPKHASVFREARNSLR